MPASVDLEKETVISGRVVNRDGQAVGGAFVPADRGMPDRRTLGVQVMTLGLVRAPLVPEAGPPPRRGRDTFTPPGRVP